MINGCEQVVFLESGLIKRSLLDEFFQDNPDKDAALVKVGYVDGEPETVIINKSVFDITKERMK